MSPTSTNTDARSVRARYAFLFDSVAELYWLRYGKRPSKRFEEIKIATEKLKEDGFLSEFLAANLVVNYEAYPSLLPGKAPDQEWLNKLHELLNITIGDLCAEIKEITDKSESHSRETLIRSLLG